MTSNPTSRPPSPTQLSRFTPALAGAYRGRFAPSPTGPLHFGSLIAALGSFLDARAHGGQWLVRIEDLDSPREQAGAGNSILRSLEALGLNWDGAVLYQHTRLDAYQSALDTLLRKGRAYPCGCSRREIADSSVRRLDGPVYPGTCRNGLPPGKTARAVRVRIPGKQILEFDDELQGTIRQHLANDIGDFILRRADGYFAYQLAVVVDDAFQHISHVVRGADLMLSTPRQIYLQRLLGLPTPIYMHLPAVLNAAGEKLSKQTGAAPLDVSRPTATLFKALEVLHQSPLPALLRGSPADLLCWATAHWKVKSIGRAHACHTADYV